MTWTNLNEIGGVLEAMGGSIFSKLQPHVVLLGVVLSMFSSGTVLGVGMWAFESWGKERFAQIEDLNRLEAIVQENQETIQSTEESVQQLSLIVLDAEISRVENQIRMLEDKETLSSQERQYLADLQRKLEDLQVQRAQVFADMMLRE